MQRTQFCGASRRRSLRAILPATLIPFVAQLDTGQDILPGASASDASGTFKYAWQVALMAVEAMQLSQQTMKRGTFARRLRFIRVWV